MNKKYYWLFALLAFIYLVSFVVEVPNPEVLAQHKIKAADVFWINMTASIPLLVIWFTGFFGFINLRRYAQKIKRSPDGKAFMFLTAGLATLVLGLSISSIISRWLVNAANADMIGWQLFTIIDTHLNVLYPLIGFALILAGAIKLIRTTKKAVVSIWQKICVAAILATVSIAYVVLIFTNTSREATFQMPDWLILTTIVLPYLVVLSSGFFATLLISAYYRNVGGILYKKALKKINLGFIFVIFALSLIQFILATSSLMIKAGFGSILALVYVLLILLAVGFVKIARGSKGLVKLEEAT